MNFDVYKIREDFPILSQRVYGLPLVYLDNGATAQKPKVVIDMVNYLHNNLNANVHRGVHSMSEQMTELYEAAREGVRAFIGAESTQEIVFTSGATASINLVAYSLGDRIVHQGDNVLITEMEHHSNIVPWQLLCQRKGAELRVASIFDDGSLDMEAFERMCDDRTRIVAVTGASNVLGTRPDLDKIIHLAHHCGAKVLIDGCQSVVHGEVNVAALGCDFFVFSGHKLYAPTGIGVLYGKKELLDSMPPFMSGGDMVKTVTFQKTTYAELPLKFEAGTSNFIGAIALSEAIDYISQVGVAQIEEHEQRLLRYATERLESIDELRIYGTSNDKCSIVSFNVEGVHPYDIGMIVDKMGVAIRTGTHCAEPLMHRFGVDGMARASMAMYNTLEEIDELYYATEKAVKMLKR